MVLYPFAQEEAGGYSVVGFDETARLPLGELYVTGPDGTVPDGFSGCVFDASGLCEDPRRLRPAGTGGGAPEYISTRVVQGSVQQAMMRALSPGRALFLRCEPLCEQFFLPCPSAAGRILTQEQSRLLQERFPVHASERLLCRYCYGLSDGRAFLHLFDTPQTLRQKLALARSLGVWGAFGCFPADAKKSDGAD